jgi:3-oxoacyl-[acyl-carrier-protein] synthase-3
MYFSRIIATGGYLPSKILTNQDLANMVDTSDEWIYTRTGIKTRHIADKTEYTSDLAYKSALDAFKNGNINKNDIDGIIVATTTPDNTFPSVATKVQGLLEINKGFAFDIQAVCSGFIYALTVADSMIKSNLATKILVIGADTLSKLVDYTDRTTCILFGDGAGSVVIEKTEKNPLLDFNSGLISSELKSDGNYYDLLKTDGGVGVNQKAGTIFMNGTEVFKHATNNLSSIIDSILAKNNLTYKDIKWLIPHQANIRIINAMLKKLGLTNENTILTIEKHGNTSAASVPLALNEGIISGKIKKNDLILLEALGGGFTWGALLLRY